MGLIDILKNYTVEDENYSKAMCGLSNNIYYRLKDEKSTAPVKYEQAPKKLTQADIDAVKVERIFSGEPKVFNRTVPASSECYDDEDISIISTASLRDMYPLDKERILTAEEEARVPDLGEWYVVPEWSMKTAQRIAASKRFRKGISNILLYGPSGTGKTEGSQAIAEMLGLPYYTQTCSPDDDKFDILGQLIPNTGKGKDGDTDEACNDLQEAVYSRINLIKQIPEPTEDELFSRTKAQTGFGNAALLRKMAKCVVDIHQYCCEKDITGGVCGPREQIDWAQDAILESEERGEDRISEKAVIAAALETVLEKVAQNEDDIEDVIAGVFNKHFSPSAVNAMRVKK
jgi:hypothetical protein